MPARQEAPFDDDTMIFFYLPPKRRRNRGVGLRIAGVAWSERAARAFRIGAVSLRVLLLKSGVPAAVFRVIVFARE
jgi:hypothetical protein